jgi:hypothetical protein
MSNEPDLIFLTDHKRFLDSVTNDDADARVADFDNFEDIVLCEIVRYGVYNREEMISPLATFYRDLVMKMPEERRFGISRHIASLIENVSYVSTNALLPFIAEDNARRVVSTSVIDYVSLAPLTDNDPMSRVKDIIGMIESGTLKNDGAAFGALLNLGDERVCRLLLPLRDALDHDAMNEAVKCSTGFMYDSVVDFYLTWLEGMSGDDQDGAFGIIGSGLGLLKKMSRTDLVFTGQRPFPMRDVRTGQLKKTNKPIALNDYLKQISSRMYALERSEPPPRIMPHVLLEWGLQPLTDSAGAAPLGDRSRSE